MLRTVLRLLGLRRDDPTPPLAKKSSTMLRLQQSAARTMVNHELNLQGKARR